MPEHDAWPALPYDEWQPTYATLHMYSQIVGKVRLALAPMMNHWWQVPHYVTARGLTTSPMPHGDRTFQIDLDLLDHAARVEVSDGARAVVELGGSVREFHRDLMAALDRLDLPVHIWPVPVEVAEPIPFPDDDVHATYDPAHARRFFDVVRRVDVAFKAHRARFGGKSSAVHFFWGSFDLAVTRFSGRPAEPRPDADRITRLSYNAELSSLGFWPGGDWFGTSVAHPIVYSYTFPEPEGFGAADLGGAPGAYDAQLGEFVLDYEAVRAADDPAAAILAFADATFAAGARLQRWPAELQRDASQVDGS